MNYLCRAYYVKNHRQSCTWIKSLSFQRDSISQQRILHIYGWIARCCQCFIAEDDMVVMAADLFAGGTETTTATLLWGILFMVNHPEIRRKVQVGGSDTQCWRWKCIHEVIYDVMGWCRLDEFTNEFKFTTIQSSTWSVNRGSRWVCYPNDEYVLTRWNIVYCDIVHYMSWQTCQNSTWMLLCYKGD